MKQVADIEVRTSVCPNCGASVHSPREETDVFAYGVGENAVPLSVQVPVYSCSCGTTFTDGEAEDRRHDAVCRHLGVLTPTEIRNLRLQNNLSRSEFARLTRIGEATLARWERGSLIQNAGYDQLLRLLQYSENIERLRHASLDTKSGTVTKLATFRYLTRSRELEEARDAFRLQKKR